MKIPVRCFWPWWVEIEGWGGGGLIKQLEDIILAWLLGRDAHKRSFLGRIGTGGRCCAKLHLVSREGLTLKHGGVERNGSRKWDAPPPKEALLLQEEGVVFL